MKSLRIKSGVEYSLSRLDYNDIFLRRVESPRNEFRDLLTHFQIISEYPDRKITTLFHPSTYASLYRPNAITDDFVKVIRNCKFKKLILNSPAGDFDLILYYEKANFLIDLITINTVRQIDGTTYSLHPQSLNEIIRKFSDVRPVRSVFIAHDVSISFQSMYGPVFSHVITALTGLDEDKLNYVRDIVFVEPSTGKKRLSLYEEKGE